MTNVCFKVPVTPYGKGRPRFSSVNGRPVAYTPPKTREHEKVFKIYARQAMRGRYPFERETPIKVTVKAYFPVPKSYSKQKRLDCLNGTLPHMHKPDIDNIQKAALDAMNETVFWDDCQVFDIHVTKLWTDKPEGYLEIGVFAYTKSE